MANEIISKVAAKLVAKCGGWNEEYCWYYLRQEFPGADVTTQAGRDCLSYYADRIERLF